MKKIILPLILFFMIGIMIASATTLFEENFNDMNTSEEISDNNIHYILPDYRGYFQKVSGTTTIVEQANNSLDNTTALNHHFGYAPILVVFAYRKDNINQVLGTNNILYLDGRVENLDSVLNLYFDDGILTYSFMDDFGFNNTWHNGSVIISSIYNNKILRNISFFHNHTGLNTFAGEIDNIKITGIPSTTLFQESFGTAGSLSFTKANCSDNYIMLNHSQPFSVDNKWYCYYDNNPTTISIAQSSSLDCATSRCVELGVTGSDSLQEIGLATFPNPITFQANDTIEMSCYIPNTTSNYSYYLMLGTNTTATEFALSLKNGGCDATTAYLDFDSCCEIYDRFLSTDCASGVELTFSTTIQDLISTCSGNLSLSNINNVQRIDVVSDIPATGVADNWFVDDILIQRPISNVTPPTPPFNFTSITYFNETFTKTRDFYYDKVNCSNVCFNSKSCFQSFSVVPLALDNDWYCSQDSAIANTIYLQDTSDTTKIDTAKGLDVVSDTFLNVGTRSKYFVSFFPNTTDLSDENMTFSWTCDIPTQASSVDVFLGLADSSLSQKILIGMGKDDTQESRCNDTGLGLTTPVCCDLSQIVGQANDCKTSTKTKVSITEKQIVDACPEIGDYDFTSINQIGFWIYTYNLVSLNQFYLDDLQVFNSLTEVGNNTLPVIASVYATPNPANVSQPVNWDIYVFDDDVIGDIYTAFDCNNDGTLEYNWAIRPTNVSKVWNFTCSAYGSVGFKTAKAYASDTTHYPYGVNASNTGSVEVKLFATDDAERGGSCSGFTAPSCLGECVFYDDYNYNYAITCNGWEGTDKHPRNQVMRIDNMNASEFSIERNFDNINDYEYDSFIFSLDFKIDTTDRITMTIDDVSLGKYLPYIYWENGFLYSLDSVSPYVQNLGNFTLGETYTLLGVADFNTNKITYSVFGTNYTPEFFDIDIAKVNRITINWYSGTNFTIDNVLIATGTANENGTAPVTYSNYVYDGNMFCGVNWTKEPPRFSQENCQARGYLSNPYILSLCPLRACIADTGSYIIQKAQQNILQTIIIVVAFILIAPLIVALASKRRR